MASPRRLRWFQFSLRGLIVAMTLLSVSIGSFVWRIDRARRQKEAIEHIRARFGGGRRSGEARVWYDYKLLEPKTDDWLLPEVDYQRSTSMPAFLINRFGIDFFHDVVMVQEGHPEYWGHPSATVEEKRLFWKQAAGLRRLLAFEPPPGCFDRLGLQQFEGHRQLAHLNLISSPVENDDLEIVGRIPALRSLNISYSKITDAGLRHLNSLSELRSLDLSGTEISGSSLKSLARLPHLHHLDLSNTYLDAAGLKQLESFQTLTEIDISAYNGGHPQKMSLTDGDLDTLPKIRGLKTVLIYENRFTLANIRRVQSESGIQFLNPWRQPVTETDVSPVP